ncbi:competence protein ComFB [Desulfohalotomaculum tongense]|uniref:late competence development ComFB family protein n=1 Tax=Desulforadius tongensis TaxID=1216062 RepID=UPI0019566221|nr:late competence development ComFB family protein [Desulforadius tongensis]MBM7854082.1 competence protein ComFB [Desulforadius tongensis]
MLHNYTETAVLQLLNEVLKNYDGSLCTCERCRQDIIALALNNLPPRYIVTDTGEIITQVSFNHFGGRAQVIAQIVKAVETVAKNPRH